MHNRKDAPLIQLVGIGQRGSLQPGRLPWVVCGNLVVLEDHFPDSQPTPHRVSLEQWRNVEPLPLSGRLWTHARQLAFSLADPVTLSKNSVVCVTFRSCDFGGAGCGFDGSPFKGVISLPFASLERATVLASFDAHVTFTVAGLAGLASTCLGSAVTVQFSGLTSVEQE